MDESLTRRGQPCWYKCKGVGHIAINDAVTIEALVFKILKRHFAQDECYLQLAAPQGRTWDRPSCWRHHVLPSPLASWVCIGGWLSRHTRLRSALGTGC